MKSTFLFYRSISGRESSPPVEFFFFTEIMTHRWHSCWARGKREKLVIKNLKCLSFFTKIAFCLNWSYFPTESSENSVMTVDHVNKLRQDTIFRTSNQHWQGLNNATVTYSVCDAVSSFLIRSSWGNDAVILTKSNLRFFGCSLTSCFPTVLNCKIVFRLSPEAQFDTLS